MEKKNVNILVVDDLEVSRDLISWELQEHGFRISCAASGEEAISLIKEKDGGFDYVLMDQVLMKGMDGIEATRIIHEQFPGIRTIVMTLYGDGESSRQALDAQAYRYVFRSSNLEETVEEIVALIESADELAHIEKSLLVRGRQHRFSRCGCGLGSGGQDLPDLVFERCTG